MTTDAARLLTANPRVFWGKVVWVFIQRGWNPPKPDERVTEDLLAAFHRVGHTVPDGNGNVGQLDGALELTARQLQLLQLFADGYDSNAAATLLGITQQTVKWHVSDMLSRLDANNRAHAVAIAFRRGWLA